MKRVIVFGTGKGYIQLKSFFLSDVEVIAFCDNDSQKWNCEFENIIILNPKDIQKYDFDYLIIASIYYKEIEKQLQMIGIDNHRIISGYSQEGIDISNVDIFDENKEIEYTIDGLNIKLNMKHMLPIYQEKFCYYDKINSYLAEVSYNGGSNGIIIDIGANVGDTTVSMLKHTESSFLCVEPDKKYYEILRNNVEMWKGFKSRIMIENAFIALDSTKTYNTVRNYGTAKKVEAEYLNVTVPTYTLKELIQKYNISLNQIELIKIDTDGYDWECILSMGDIIKDTNCIFYWENYFENEKQYKGFIQAINYLEEAKYSHFFCFDNFGNFLAEGNAQLVRFFCDYLNRINIEKTAKTFYYIDVLACKEGKQDKIFDMIKKIYSFSK